MSETTTTCESCGCESEYDRCEECEYQQTTDCNICEEQIEIEDASDFILMKADLSATGQRPPGVYLRKTKGPFMVQPMLGAGWLTSHSVLFVDKLPKRSDEYDLSGYICQQCSKKYADIVARIYESDRSWDVERKFTRDIILANPDMLRDLECDSVSKDEHGKHLRYANDNDWNDIKKIYDLPDLPTFHEWIFVEHNGVKVFQTRHPGYFSGDDPGWLALSPEPRFRSGAGCLFPQTFAPCSLPTHEGFDNDWNSKYYIGRRKAIEAVVSAIDQGILRQDGIFDESGQPITCR